MESKTLTKDQQSEALGSLLFLLDKLNGDIKVRGCADENIQSRREVHKKEDATSTIVSNEEAIITCSIEAYEERELACFGITGEYLQTLNDKEVIILIKGPLAELMVMVDQSVYRRDVILYNKGVPLLYAKMNKALYGLLKSTLLLYKKLRGELESIGFETTKTLLFPTITLISPR